MSLVEPDLTGFSVIHRAMLAELERLSWLGAEMSASARPLGRERAAALSAHVQELCAEIHHHHSREDELVWPTVREYAGGAVDLDSLTGDHRELDPLLSRLAAAAQALEADSRCSPADFADTAARLNQLLHDHIGREEQELFPIIRRHVPPRAWAATEQRMGKGISLSHVRWLIPWVERYATPAERAHINEVSPPVFRLLLTLNRKRFATLERTVFARPRSAVRTGDAEPVHDPRPVLVVGSTGAMGSHVVSALSTRGVPVRVLVRDPARMRHVPAVELCTGDLANPADVQRALHGVRAAFYISPHDDAEVDLARIFLTECELASVRLVFAGVHMADPKPWRRTAKAAAFGLLLPHYRGKFRIGAMIARSPIRPVVLVPTNFMQNDEFARSDILAGRFTLPLAGCNRVDLRDLGEITARVLTDPTIEPNVYPIVGPESVSGHTCARLWSEALRRPIRYTGDDDAEWTALMRRSFTGRKLADMLATWSMLRKRSLSTSRDELAVTTRLLGRLPRSYQQYVRDTATEWTAKTPQ